MKKKLLILASCLLLVPLSKALGQDSAKNALDKDSAHIVRFKNLVLFPFFAYNSLNLNISSKLYPDSTFIYQPNVGVNLGMRLGYAGYGLALSMRTTAKDEDIYGKTDYIDFRASYFRRHLGISGNLQQYEGFYYDIENKDDTQDLPDDYIRPQNSDLRLFNAGIHLYYFFSDHFSYSAAFSHNERQKSSGGSWVAMLAYSYTVWEADDHIIPRHKQYLFPEDGSLKHGVYHSLRASPGYGYTLVWRKFYLTGVGHLGFGWQHQNYLTANKRIVHNKGLTLLQTAWALGYNGQRLLAGVNVNLDAFTVSMRDMNLFRSLYTVKWGIGIRLGQEKEFDWRQLFRRQHQ